MDVGLSLSEYIEQNGKKNNHISQLVGAEFELTCLEVLKNMSEYKGYEFYLYPKLVQDYKVLFNLPHYDYGIDIVGIDLTNKKTLLVQCKYTKNTDKVFTYGTDKLSHLSAQQNRFHKSTGFRSEKWQSEIMVMTTGRKTSGCETDLIVKNGTDLSGKLVFSRINDSIKTEKITLREYQETIIENLAKFYDFKTNKIGKLLMATGSGKTLTIANYLFQNWENIKEKNIIFVAPTLSLVDQIYRVLASYFSTEKDITILKICSDGSTDIDIEYGNKNIYVATYDSFHLLGEIDDNFIILDEAHHAVNQNIQKILAGYQNSDVLYLTATEKIYDSKSGDGDDQKWKNAMKDIPLIDKYNIGQGIKDGYLSDYNIEIISFTGDKNTVLGENIIEKILNDENKKIIIYCNRVKKAEEFRDYLRDLFKKYSETYLVGKKIMIESISGEDKLWEKSDIFERFTNSDIGIILNVGIVSEGIDLPCIDTVFFYDNRKSRIELIQNIGRCLRIYPGKKFSTVCINLDMNEFNPDLSDENSELLEKICKPVYKALMYLSTEDETYSDYYKHYGKKMGFLENKKIKFSGNMVTNLDNNIISQTYDRFLDKTMDLNWDKKCKMLEQFVGDNNRLPSQGAEDIGEKILARWINTNRSAYSKDKLSQDRVEKLENIPLWSWNPKADQWYQGYTDLVKWIETNKSLPKMKSEDLAEKILGSWISNNRNGYNNGKLSQDKIEKLENIPFWSWDPNRDRWDQGYTDLVKWVGTNNGLPRFDAQDPTEKTLGNWIRTNRSAYSKDKLSQDRVEKLENIPFWSWDPNQEKWQQGYTDLVRWVETNKGLPKEKAQDPTEKTLGRWIGTNRKAYSKSKLSQDRIGKLENIQFWSWNPKGEKWDQGYTDLVKWIETNKDLPKRDAQDPTGKTLGNWISRNRTEYNRNKLSQDRLRMIQLIPEFYLDIDNPFDTIYRWTIGYKFSIKYWIGNRKFAKSVAFSESRFYRYIHSKNTKLQPYQKYIKNDIWCIENGKMSKDLSLASKYLISLSDKISISEYHESIKKSVDIAINILSTNQDLRKKLTDLEIKYLILMDNIIDEHGILLNKTRMEKLETYYGIHQLLQKLLILIQEKSDYSELIKIFSFYHCGAYPDNILEYVREVFITNDLQLFVTNLDDVWK